MRRRVLLAVLAGALASCAAPRAWLARARFFGGDPLRAERMLFEDGRCEKVVLHLKEARIAELPRRRRSDAYELLGACHQRLGNLPAALQTYQIGAALHPRDVSLLTHLADLLYRSDMHDRARPHYEKILSLRPHDAQAHLGLAEILRLQGNLAGSQRHYEKALEEWDRNPGVWRDYAHVLADRGDYKAAAAALDKALELSPTAETLLSSARFHRRHGAAGLAYTRLEEARMDDPARLDLALQKSLWLLEDGRPEEALAQAQTALAADPDHPLGRWIRASVALRRGDLARAREDFTAAAQVEASHPFIAKTARAALNQLFAAP